MCLFLRQQAGRRLFCSLCSLYLSVSLSLLLTLWSSHYVYAFFWPEVFFVSFRILFRFFFRFCFVFFCLFVLSSTYPPLLVVFVQILLSSLNSNLAVADSRLLDARGGRSSRGAQLSGAMDARGRFPPHCPAGERGGVGDFESYRRER